MTNDQSPEGRLLAVVNALADSTGSLSERADNALTLVMIAGHMSLEEATLNGKAEAERGRLLAHLDRVREFITEWSPMTPDDYRQLDDVLNRGFRDRDDTGDDKKGN